MYDAERADARALDQLEAILREVAEELTALRARAAKPGAVSGRTAAAESRSGTPEMETENRQLKTRLETARTRLQDLLTRITFLEEQGREQLTSGGAGGAGR